MLPPIIGGGIKWWCCLTSVCLSVAYIGPKSRTERPRKTKIGTEVAHVTRDSDTTFKVKRSKVKVTSRSTHRGVNASGSCRGDRGEVLTVGTYSTFRSADAVGSAARGALSPTEGGERRDILWRPPAYSLLLLFWLSLFSAMITLNQNRNEYSRQIEVRRQRKLIN